MKTFACVMGNQACLRHYFTEYLIVGIRFEIMLRPNLNDAKSATLRRCYVVNVGRYCSW